MTTPLPDICRWFAAFSFAVFCGHQTIGAQVVAPQSPSVAHSSSVAQTISQTAVAPAPNQWTGRRIAYLGDSITDPNHRAASKKYWHWLAEWFGTESYVYARSGRRWDDIPRQTDLLLREHGQEVDAIVIMCGTNDFNAAVPIGGWWTVADTLVDAAVHAERSLQRRRVRTHCTDAATFCGRLNIALAKLKAAYPTKQIILLTPIHRAYAEFSSTNVQPSESAQNACGEWLDAYVDMVRQAASVWAVPVIDTYSLCGLFPTEDAHGQYFANPATDRLHPNNAGHLRLAQTLRYQLLALPAVFEE